tara:strand:- start:384 stop:494 length:111 start_codon:yes stop_codon:yes gene_type:complete
MKMLPISYEGTRTIRGIKDASEMDSGTAFMYAKSKI